TARVNGVGVVPLSTMFVSLGGKGRGGAPARKGTTTVMRVSEICDTTGASTPAMKTFEFGTNPVPSIVRGVPEAAILGRSSSMWGSTVPTVKVRRADVRVRFGR